MMSAIGPKQTLLVAPHMSPFGAKADMALCGNSLWRSLLGVKRTCSLALHMSAFDPKRTSGPAWPPTIIKVSINSVRMEASNALFHRHAGERDSGGNVRRRQWA